MMDEIQNCIADAQYGQALKNVNSTLKPLDKFPEPTTEEYQKFLKENDIDLEYILDSPIGLFNFKEYVSRFEKLDNIKRYRSIMDFLVTMKRFREMETPDSDAATQLLEIAENCPTIYADSVSTIKKKLKQSGLNQALRTHRTPGTPGAPRGRNLLSFGGLNVGENMFNLDNVVSSTDVELDKNLEPAEAEQLRQQAEISANISKRKQNVLLVFADLTIMLTKKAEELIETFKASPEYKKTVNSLWYAQQDISQKDFIVFRDLGRGAFGVVSSAKMKYTGKLIAIKQINKKLVKQKDAKKLVLVEKKILQKLGENPSAFTVWLKYSFQDKDYFYMSLPLCTGGDLGFHLTKKGYFNVKRAKYHTAEIVLGLMHLHSLGIIYRDLKPENVIFDDEGHCRISDMGLAVIAGARKIKGRAGTPGYWAPEVISKQHYSFSADYWSLGCCLHEMLAGICPFSKTNTGMPRDQATLTWEIKCPDFLGPPEMEKKIAFPKDAENLIHGLLDRDRFRRIGSMEIKTHPFFADIDWQALEARELPPPWKPKAEQIHAANQTDIEYQNNDRDYRHVKLTSKDEINDFDYVSRYAHQVDIVDVLSTDREGKLKIDKPFDTTCCIVQ